jgi:hypothetical protein
VEQVVEEVAEEPRCGLESAPDVWHAQEALEDLQQALEHLQTNSRR